MTNPEDGEFGGDPRRGGPRHGGRGRGGGWDGEWQAGPPRFGGGRGRGRGRARRGDIRTAILLLLNESPKHGYELIQVLDERTDGLWKPSPGSIYPALSLLEDEGLIVADAATGKRQFTLTDNGREAVAQIGDTTPPWEQVTTDAGSDVVGLRDAMKQFIGAWRQVMEVGSNEQRTAAVEILNKARRQLYVLLADEA